MEQQLKNQIGAALEASQRGETVTGAVELLAQLKSVPGFAKSLLEIVVDQSVGQVSTRYCCLLGQQRQSPSRSLWSITMVLNHKTKPQILKSSNKE